MEENEVPSGDSGETSLRDDIANAMDQVESRDAPPAAPAPAQAPVASEPAPTPAAPAAGERARGPDGRFQQAPKPAAAPAVPRPAATPPRPAAAPTPAAAPAPQLRAPASWRPQARESWAKVPTEVQQEVVRREMEVGRALQESSQARNALSHVQSALAPYAANIQATGGDAIACMISLFRADHVLRHGSLAEKAHMAADIIKNYGVDLATLDSVLAGQQPQADPNAALADKLRREMQAQLQPVLQYFGGIQGQRQQALQQINQNASSEVAAFGQDAAHEFYEDVRNDMADIIDLYTARGASISLQEAYERAINLHPQVREIVAKRAEAERASAAAQAAQRARRTAASITSAPAPAGAVPGPVADDRRAALAAAFDAHSNG